MLKFKAQKYFTLKTEEPRISNHNITNFGVSLIHAVPVKIDEYVQMCDFLLFASLN